jgi:hypothetical protein
MTSQPITFGVYPNYLNFVVKVLGTFKLLQEKKLECIDDSLQKYSPEFSVKNPFNKDSITIRWVIGIRILQS